MVERNVEDMERKVERDVQLYNVTLNFVSLVPRLPDLFNVPQKIGEPGDEAKILLRLACHTRDHTDGHMDRW